ncbi:MAG: mechanosensitive ion channel [Candidatus Methanomethylicia archaeon]|nr:mechanosensitive ion channel [Candidatus Methanomethylicia archaeon]
MPDGDRPSPLLEYIMASVALISIALLVIEYAFPLSEAAIGEIYAVDLAICIAFAADFLYELYKSASRSSYLKGHWIDLAASVPAYFFVFLESITAFGIVLRSLRLVRFLRFLAVMARIRRSKGIGAVGHAKPGTKLGGALTISIAITAFYALFRESISSVPYGTYILETLASVAIVAGALALAELIIIIASPRIDALETRHSFEQAIRVFFVGLAAVAVVSFVFKELLILAFSLGVFGLILSYSLSPMISNFISWIYIALKKVYVVGDSVKIGGTRGIVTKVGYFTTTLLEIGDESSYWSVTGRILTIPNSMVLSEIVATYGTRKSPVRVGSITFDLAYESNLEEVRLIMIKSVQDYMRSDIDSMIKHCEENNCEERFIEVIKAGPRVIFEPSSTWIQATVLYPCLPSKIVRSVSDLTEIILREFNARPEVVKFPATRSR